MSIDKGPFGQLKRMEDLESRKWVFGGGTTISHPKTMVLSVILFFWQDGDFQVE